MQSLPINGESIFLYPSINVFAMRLNIGFEVSRFDEQGAEGFAYLGESSIGNGVSRHDDVSVFAVDERDQPCEILVNPSFRQISDDAFAYLFAYAHAHFNALGGHELEYEKGVRVRLTFAINGRLSALRGDDGSALSSAAGKHFSAALGGHSLTETVNFALLSFLRLVGSFHNDILLDVMIYF